jgi:hypothetical protein
VGRFLPVVLAATVMMACQSQTQAVATPSPSPIPTPHTAPTLAILQSSEAPAGLNVCVGSGPIDVYLATLSAANAPFADAAASQWADLLHQGARDGAIAIFAASTSACTVELGSAAGTRAITSFVAQFADEGEADRAWQAGVFGFVPPPVGEVATGLVRGPSTGLGLSSFTYERPSVRLACWRRSVFVAVVVASNLDAGAFKSATAAVDPRLN